MDLTSVVAGQDDRGRRSAGSASRAVVAVLIAALVVACGGTPMDVARSGGASAGAGSPSVPPRPTIVPIPGHEVYGFVPYWEMDDSIADHIGATDLTTLALFSVTHRRNGTLDDQNGYRRIRGRGRAAPDRRRARARRRGSSSCTPASVTAKNRPFYEEPEAQERWIDGLVALVDELDVDGINVDVEALPIDSCPTMAGSSGGFATRFAFVARDGQVSVATQANELGAAMAAAAGAAGADRIFLMGYDYRWAGSEPGASAPIDRLDGETQDLVWSLDLYARARRAGRPDDPRAAAVRR